MKRIVISALSLIVISFSCLAAEVSQATLRQVAANFWNAHRPADVKAVSLSDLQIRACSELPHLGIFAVADQGFVVLAADDRVQPVLAYSFTDPFPTELHPSLRYWLGGYEKQIAASVKLGLETPSWIGQQWSNLLYGELPVEPKSLTNVPALCATKWNQSGINDSYNRFCPYDSIYNSRTVVGCVATAMAQIMKYWNHPSFGTGSHSFEHHGWPDYNRSYGTLSADFEHTTYIWNYMPTALSPSTPDQKINAVALLSYHCGVAVDMMYGTSYSGGSSAYVNAWDDSMPCAENAFKDYFRYDTAIFGAYREDYDSLAWANLIEADLAAGRPILYTGDDTSGGHAFVLDGSDIEGRYHFNWGWGGYGDGFYAIHNLAPGGGGDGGNATYTFNLYQSALFNIFPVPQTFDTVDITDTICNNISVYHFYEYDLDVVTNSYQLVHLDTVFNLDVVAIKKKYMYLSPNYYGGEQTSSVFCPADSVEVPECPFTREGYFFHHWNTRSNNEGIDIYPGDMIKRGGSFTLYAQWVDSASLPDTTDTLGIALASLSDAVTLGPNPTTGHLTVQAPAGSSVSVIDALGRMVATVKAIDGKAKFDLTDQPAGLFTVQVRSSKAVCNKRIIRL